MGFMNAIVLLLEVIYYSLFMKFSKKDGKLWKYILLFAIINIFFGFIGTYSLFFYIILVIFILLGMKYIVKIKTTFYDMLIIFLMLLTKLIIETPLYIILIRFIDNFYVIIVTSILKIILLLTFKNKLNKIYNYLKEKWNKNNFYIRYIFTVIFYSYVIISCIFLFIQLAK